MDYHYLYTHDECAETNYDIDNVHKSCVARFIGMIGKHCILEMYDCNKNKLNDEAFIRNIINLGVKAAEAKLINLITHKFSPQGVTGLALLAESHISIHTWPEIGYGAVDIFTCGEYTKPEKACDVFVKEFSAQKFSLRQLQRETPNQISNSLRKVN